jgi:steroid delta-isomerase-like uncharacterized protein
LGDEESSEMTTEHNKTIVRRFFEEVVSNGNLAVVDELCSRDYRVHATLSGPDAIGLDQMRELVRSFRSSFPDARITIEDMVAEGDRVAARLREQGTHGGEFRGIPPTGRRVSYGSMTFLRLVDGKIAEHWGLLDMPSLLQQLDGIPA